jgi:hypothetical protein
MNGYPIGQKKCLTLSSTGLCQKTLSANSQNLMNLSNGQAKGQVEEKWRSLNGQQGQKEREKTQGKRKGERSNSVHHQKEVISSGKWSGQPPPLKKACPDLS